MKITNRHNLPEGIVKAVTNDSYDKGSAHYSVSQLIMPPQMLRLMQLHWNELTTDVADEIWKLFGSSVHYILDQAQVSNVEMPDIESQQRIMEQVSDISTKYLTETKNEEDVTLYYSQLRGLMNPNPVTTNPLVNTEKRLYGSIGGIKISGKPDWYHTITKQIEDYKVTQVYKVMKGDHTDWESQGNGYAWLLRENGEEPETFKINAILKDWKPSEMKRDEAYPRAPVEIVDIKLWTPLEQVEFMLNRIKLHESLKAIIDPDELFETVPCTNSEKWHGTDTFAIKKRGGTRAVNGGVFTDLGEANKFLQEKGSDHYLEKRLGTNKRCEEYCLVKQFCSQRKHDIGEKDGHATVKLDEPKDKFSDFFPDKKPEPSVPLDADKVFAKGSEESIRGKKEKDISSMIDDLSSKKDTNKESEPIIKGSSLDDLLNNLGKEKEEKKESVAEIKQKYDDIATVAKANVEAKYSEEKPKDDTPDKNLLDDINLVLGQI